MEKSVHICLASLLFVTLLTNCATHPDVSVQSPAKPVRKSSALPAIPTQSNHTTLSTKSNTASNYAQQAEVQVFIKHMVDNHNFSERYLTSLFAQANRLDNVIRLETGGSESSGPPKPLRPGSWSRYRAIFLTEPRIQDGVKFWINNTATIEKASARYGVDPEYIVSIIGVETFFGRNVGKTCVFDALTTLAFDTPRRSKFFKSELENFLLMTREEGYEPRKLVGSWAGAMGLGQFMPSSFRRLAVDFDRNGKRNLWDPEDAIGSVAHYFSKNGWQSNRLVAEQTHAHAGKTVIDLSTYNGDEYWQTYHNFKVIKRYNNSKKYAMAVHQLALAIKERLPLATTTQQTGYR